MTPRIAPLGADERDEATASLLDGLPGAHLNIVATMLRHPDLAEHFDVLQLVEIPMLVGLYHMVAFFGSSLGVEQEPGEETLP